MHNGRALKKADPSTIQDKLLVGYQGWFTCAGDGEPGKPLLFLFSPRRSERLFDSPLLLIFSRFALLFARAWFSPITNRVTHDAVKIVGRGHHGWLHWFNYPVPDGGRPNTDIWPDVSEYDASELYEAPGLKTQSGEKCYLFSSRDQKTVDRSELIATQWIASN